MSESRADTSPPLLRSTTADRAAAVRDRRHAAQDREQAAELLASAYRDELTGALTRRAGREQLSAEVQRAHRSHAGLSMVFVDVDALKRTNDAYGHSCGDALLVATAASLRDSLRSYDVVVRWGGDEFLCALPGGTGDVARDGVTRARAQLDIRVPGATFSAGFAELLGDETLASVVDRADADLYARRAVARGRDGCLTGVPPGPVAAAPERRRALAPTVACGACGGRLPLSTFSLAFDDVVTRLADCASCGETTVIRLCRGGSGV